MMCSAIILDHVEAALTYTARGGQRPVATTPVAGAETEYPMGGFEEHNAAIGDARSIRNGLSLDTYGFVLTENKTRVVDFFDETQIRTVYYREIEDLITSLTRATRVVTFDHTVRHGDKAVRQARNLREPVKVVHNDYTDWSGPQRVRDLLPDEAETLLRDRFAIIQAWQPIQDVVRRHPLAICDARTITSDDLIAAERRHPNRVGEVYHLAHSEAHRWYYVPNMQRSETLVFKTYESDTGGRARFTAHGSFDDPSTSADAPPRHSIEVRLLAFFGA